MKITYVNTEKFEVTVVINHPERAEVDKNQSYVIRIEADPDSGTGNKIKSIFCHNNKMLRSDQDKIMKCESIFSDLLIDVSTAKEAASKLIAEEIKDIENG